MSDLKDIAAQAEKDLNSHELKHGVQEGTGFGGKDQRKGASDSTLDSGINLAATNKFPGATAEYTSREIPPEQGGGVQRGTGKTTKFDDFDKGEAGEGPDDVARREALDRGGDSDIVDGARGVNAESNNRGVDQ